ncbi:HSPA12A [Cordylochernes scorpioides]|uniref:HSPA12A n=1 Tax=Cordylochernes scorpioides TaxID=51811 RepID=A0ABY6KSF9_9ARAC|nr:HSPA12A [Cordylochernes scorpioides]
MALVSLERTLFHEIHTGSNGIYAGGDPGLINQKTPTTILLTPEGEFHSFGYTARDNYHDLDPEAARQWFYLDKFKMVLHHNENLSLDTELTAANGRPVPAVNVFAHALAYFREQALSELSEQAGARVLNEDVRWVVTVPAIWRQPAKQFMRAAAYKAGIASPEYPEQLLIALEPEAASIYCRRLRLHQLVPDHGTSSPRTGGGVVENTFHSGTRYMVVDCGGGTVDITVHEMLDRQGTLKELHKATGGPYGSVGVDREFERLLGDIFGHDFIDLFKTKRPAGFVDLMVGFEARKRNGSPYKNTPINISLPFSFIDYYKKHKGSSTSGRHIPGYPLTHFVDQLKELTGLTVTEMVHGAQDRDVWRRIVFGMWESAVKKHGSKDVRWSSQGMLRLEQSSLLRLFQPTLDHIRRHVANVLNSPTASDVSHMFLVGGFAESQILQKAIRDEFSARVQVIIPQGVSLAILKGAVLFGIDPTVVNVRRLRMTYGVGVLNRFMHGFHPSEKLIVKDGVEWCSDVFDKIVVVDQSVGLGDIVCRSYTPAKTGQLCSVLNIYCSEREDVRFITDPGVRKCGTLILDLSEGKYLPGTPRRREIQARMTFGDTEIRISALDIATGKCVKAEIDFLNH